MWFWLDTTLKDLAYSVSRFLLKFDNRFTNYFQVRIEYYAEMKELELLQHHSFPAEWFEDGPTEEEVAQVDEIQADLKEELYEEKS